MNNLNSVLIEGVTSAAQVQHTLLGIIVRFTLAIKRGDLVIMVPCRVSEGCLKLGLACADNVKPGSKIRIVGHFDLDLESPDKALAVFAEHVEFKDIWQKPANEDPSKA